ncbi:MAG TPA: thiamine pyrophosphate-dependent enzyme [Mycobacteriales bacterium]|nr:thiamine pyrophosphate-dependent enzyme [Mycobacteriales bacterium]
MTGQPVSVAGPGSVDRPEPGPGGARYASDVLVDLLRALGVRYLPMTPGSSFRGLHDSVVNHGGNADPQLLLCLHEEIAVALAHGWAKAARAVGVAVVHDLVGLMHATMAVYDAYCDRALVLVLGGSGPADPAARRPVDWTHSATTQAQLVRDYVVWDAEPPTAAAAVTDVLRAFRRAAGPPAGPAYVSLDAAVQESIVDDSVQVPDLAGFAPVPPPVPAPDAVAAAARLCARATNPVLVGGRLGWDPAATPVLVELAELLGAGYVDDRNVVSFPTAHPLNRTGDPAALAGADLVIAVDVADIGGLLRARGRSRNGSGPGPTPTVIDVSLGDLGRRSWSHVGATPIGRAAHLLGDPLAGARALLDAVRPLVDRDAAAARADRVRAAGADRRRRDDARLARWHDRPIAPARLVAETWRAVAGVPHLLCVRNTRTWPTGVWQFDGAGGYLGDSGGGGVGYGPGALVGGALAARDTGRLGVGILGDGDLLMAPSALWTAVHHRIPALVVVNDNGSLYNDEAHQAEIAADRGRPAANRGIGVRVADPAIDIATLARAYGCWSTGPITDPDALGPALAEAVAAATAGAVAVVHVRTAPE